jgi:signal transduction histidine kinase
VDGPRFEQRLQDAAVMTGRVAHAFDNVLTGILGFAELTLSQMKPESAPYQYIGEVLRAAQQGVGLTQELHLFSRCGAPGAGPTSLAEVVAEEEARLRENPGSAVLVRSNLPADLPPIALDAEALRQVLRQLLDNAQESAANSINLSARRTTLTATNCSGMLGSAVPGPAVEVVITDSGSGLTSEVRQRLFHEPFFTTKPRHRGLGLAIVCRILFTHRGGLRLEPAPERGTQAHVFLPVTP